MTGPGDTPGATSNSGWNTGLYWYWILNNSVAFISLLTAVAVMVWLAVDVLDLAVGDRRLLGALVGRPSAPCCSAACSGRCSGSRSATDTPGPGSSAGGHRPANIGASTQRASARSARHRSRLPRSPQPPGTNRSNLCAGAGYSIESRSIGPFVVPQKDPLRNEDDQGSHSPWQHRRRQALAYASDSRVHLHSQIAPTSGSSWSSTCSKPSDTNTPVDGFGPGRVCARTWSTSPLATA